MKKSPYIVLLFIIHFSLFTFHYSLAAEELPDTKSPIHIISLSAGGTLIPYSSSFAANIATGYEYRLRGGFGIGFNVSGYIYDYFEFASGIPFYYHPFGNGSIWLMPGLAFTKNISYSKDVPNTDQFGNPLVVTERGKYTGNFYLAIGIGWEYLFNDDYPLLGVTPAVNCDLVNFAQAYLSGMVKIQLHLLK